jgi:hypothetical protein
VELVVLEVKTPVLDMLKRLEAALLSGDVEEATENMVALVLR